MALTDNIVSYYKWDVNGAFSDSAGSNDGTINWASYTSSWKINWCYDFDGTNDYITVPVTYSITTQFSYNAWVNIDDYTNKGQIIAHDWTWANRGTQFFIEASTGKVWFYRISSAPALVTDLISTSSLWTGGWHMVTATFDDSVGSKLYVDGILVDSDTVTTATGNCSLDVYLGKYSASSADYLNWKIDETAIWSRALTSAEVTSLYNSWAWLQYPFTSWVALDAIFMWMNF